IKYLIKYFIIYILKTKFFNIFYITFKVIFIKSNILGGFKGIRLTSFNLENIILKLNI
ncbi:hypothetical protein FOC4_g10006511, partial [Fusarium odoratissimum]